MIEHAVKMAEANTPKLFEKQIKTAKTVRIVPDAAAFFGVRAEPVGTVPETLVAGDSFVLDFGAHGVGYLSFSLAKKDIYLDAPVKLRLRFAEIPYELSRDPASYHGTLCSSWLTDEIFYFDYPGEIRLERRYSFRYLEVTVIASPRPLVLSDFTLRTVTSADESRLVPLPAGTDPELVEIDRVGAATLRDCMQTAYEDGPKRDRRLWSGDLRLQALTDQYLYRNSELARRCLYLFAACEEPGKFLPGCMYQKPELAFDRGMGLTDYALLYCVSLCDYYDFTGDCDTTADLYPLTARQTDLAVSLLNTEGVITFLDGWSRFIDWAPDLTTVTATEGVFLYALERMIPLARAMGDSERAEKWEKVLTETRLAAKRALYDPSRRAFLNAYDEYRYSVQAQVWMILGGVVSGEEGREVLRTCLASPDAIRPVTPYMHHYLVEAMMKLDMRDEALAHIKSYWGGMIKAGADTFFEAYVPGDPDLSPYEDPLMNSFCHAWSCSPSYFIRKYFI